VIRVFFSTLSTTSLNVFNSTCAFPRTQTRV
jgi:hypothetical protein